MLVQQIQPQLIRPPVADCGAATGGLMNRTLGIGRHEYIPLGLMNGSLNEGKLRQGGGADN
jgi:hypothetical protein